MQLKNIETHLHFGGCISTNFVWETIQRQGQSFLANSLNDVIKCMTFADDEEYGFNRFLNKFTILNELTWDEETIDLSIKDVCITLDKNNIDYAWMDISINKYMDIGWHKYQVIEFIYNSFNKYRPGKVGLILAIKYESMRVSQEQYFKLIENEIANKCLIGIDLVGDEAFYDAEFYAPLFCDWNAAGKITRAHVGESQSSDNVLTAIERLRVTNIAHGIKAADCHAILKMAKDFDITFDMAITSNYVTGTVEKGARHPILDIIEYGCKATISSDDMTQLQTTLQNEYNLAIDIGITNNQLEMLRSVAYENTKQLLNRSF